MVKFVTFCDCLHWKNIRKCKNYTMVTSGHPTPTIFCHPIPKHFLPPHRSHKDFYPPTLPKKFATRPPKSFFPPHLKIFYHASPEIFCHPTSNIFFATPTTTNQSLMNLILNLVFFIFCMIVLVVFFSQGILCVGESFVLHCSSAGRPSSVISRGPSDAQERVHALPTKQGAKFTASE